MADWDEGAVYDQYKMMHNRAREDGRMVPCTRCDDLVDELWIAKEQLDRLKSRGFEDLHHENLTLKLQLAAIKKIWDHGPEESDHPNNNEWYAMMDAALSSKYTRTFEHCAKCGYFTFGGVSCSCAIPKEKK